MCILVSIIIPAFNAEKYIEETLDSILQQTYHNFEIILVDDGSDDNTMNIMQEYQSGQKRKAGQNIRITMVTGNHSGAATARNQGMSVALGEYFLFFDADDIMTPDYLENMVKHMDDAEVDMVIGHAEKIDKDGKLLEMPPKIISIVWEGIYNTDNIFDLIEIGNYADTVTGTKLYKSNIILNHNLTFDDVKVADDVAFFLKYAYFCSYIYVSDNAVMKYRIASGSLSHNASNDDLDVINSFKAAEQYICRMPGLRPRSFNYLLQNMKIKDYYAWSLHYMSPAISSRTLRKRLFKRFHKEIIKEGKRYKKYLNHSRREEVKKAEKRYKLRFWYLNRLYIAIKRKKKIKESEYI